MRIDAGTPPTPPAATSGQSFQALEAAHLWISLGRAKPLPSWTRLLVLQVLEFEIYPTALSRPSMIRRVLTQGQSG